MDLDALGRDLDRIRMFECYWDGLGVNRNTLERDLDVLRRDLDDFRMTLDAPGVSVDNLGIYLPWRTPRASTSQIIVYVSRSGIFTDM